MMFCDLTVWKKTPHILACSAVNVNIVREPTADAVRSDAVIVKLFYLFKPLSSGLTHILRLNKHILHM